MSEPILNRRGLMLILSSPSGAGKTTLSRLLLEKDKQVVISISITTRAKRPAEEDGVHYYFVSPEQFKQMLQGNELLEHARVFDAMYGTPRKRVEELLATGYDVLFDIDWQGMEQLVAHAREDVVSIFILPPSLKELEKRLRGRAQDSEAVIAGRMAKSMAEISHWDSYDYVVVNNNIEESLEEIRTILQAERLKTKRQKELVPFVAAMVEEV